MLSSIRISSDLVVETCFIRTLSIKSSKDSDNVLSFYLEPININSVLVVFRVSLLQRSHLWMLLKSRFRLDCIECKSALGVVVRLKELSNTSRASAVGKHLKNSIQISGHPLDISEPQKEDQGDHRDKALGPKSWLQT